MTACLSRPWGGRGGGQIGGLKVNKKVERVDVEAFDGVYKMDGELRDEQRTTRMMDEVGRGT